MNGYEAAKAALYTPGLSPTEKLVLIALADHVNESGECRPGMESIADLTGVGRSSVLRAIKKLETIGLIKVRRSRRGGNVYNLSSISTTVTLNQGISTTVTLIPEPISTTMTLIEPAISTTVELNHAENGGISTTVTHEQKKNKKKKEEEKKVTCPSELNTSLFRESWAEFTEHRRQLKKPLTPLGAERLLKKLATWGPDVAIRALGESVENGWQGVFPPKHQAVNGSGAHPVSKDDARRQRNMDVLESLSRRYEDES